MVKASEVPRVFAKAGGIARTKLRKEGDKNAIDLWNVHYKQLTKTYLVRSKHPETRCGQRIFDWAVMLLSRT